MSQDYAFESPRLNFRKLEMSDCGETYLAWLLDPEVNRYLETRHSEQTIELIQGFVAGVNSRPNEHLFGMFRRDDGRHIGNIKVGPISALHRRGDVSLFIGDRASWGQGLATEAIAAISIYAFDTLGVAKLASGMYANNQGSYRAFIKAGYHQEGLRRQHGLIDGKLHDILECGLIAQDLAATRKALLS